MAAQLCISLLLIVSVDRNRRMRWRDLVDQSSFDSCNADPNASSRPVAHSDPYPHSDPHSHTYTNSGAFGFDFLAGQFFEWSY